MLILALLAASIVGTVETTPAKFLPETVVYLEKVPGTFPPKTLSMDQKGMKFVPTVLAISTGDTVHFLNHDGVDHNVYSPDNEGYNLGMIHKGAAFDHKFDKPGVYTQLCSVHPEMLAYIYVGENPFEAVVGKNGKYKIDKVPPGTYQVAIWNAHLKGPAQTITVAAGKSAEAKFSLHR